jgi:pimeloyl-ACP methyl ester carboxylesterase
MVGDNLTTQPIRTTETEVERAHLVGLSMGGMVAQEVAIQQPARAASLTLMMTSGFVGDP